MPSPAFEAIVELMAGNDDHELPLSERRAAMEQGAASMPQPANTTFEHADAAGVPSEWVTAAGAVDDRAVLYLHGGSYSVCSPRTHRRLTAALSKEAGVRVLAADYRLAPENPFPAALEDAVAVYRWLIDGGTAPEHLAVAGDSAGGGLTISMLVAARDAGLPMPAAAVVISPWTDLELGSDSITSKAAVDPMLSPQRLKENADRYLAGRDPRTPLASPIHADLTGLPSLLVHVGGREVLLDDAKRLAERATADGVDVTLEVYDEMIHVWHILVGLAPEGDEAVQRVAEFIRGHLPAPDRA
jgi:acetyl esterase/lipase